MTGPELAIRVTTYQRGLIESPARVNTTVLVHAGPPVVVACRRDGHRNRGRSIYGDVDIIPAGVSSHWEVEGAETTLVIGIPPQVMNEAASQAGLDHSRVAIANRFQMRDPRIEQIGWVLKSEMESGFPSGRLFLDSMGSALATCLIANHSSAMRGAIAGPAGGLTGRRLRNVLSFIEDNLSRSFSLGEVAEAAGLSVSHTKATFRHSVGLPIHQYVIRRRLERAQTLLAEGRLTVGEVALECGFAHQSHLSHHMRRILGISPKAASIRNR